VSPEGSDRESATPLLYLLTTMVLFGSAFASSKVVVDEVPHLVAAALRFGGGALILALVNVASRRGRPSAPLGWQRAVRVGAVGLVGVCAYNFFFFWGLSLAPALDGSVIVPVLSPVLTTGYLVLTGREAAVASRVAGLALGLVGAAIFLVGVGIGPAVTGSRLLGDLAYLLGAVCWSAYSLLSKKLLVGINPLQATTWGTATGAIALIVMALPSASGVAWSDVSSGAWANSVYLAIGPTAIAYVCFYRGLRSVSPATATIMMFVVPVVGTACSVAFLGERFTLVEACGAVVMICGALVAVTARKLNFAQNTARRNTLSLNTDA
jgi:drug/metabolite transporter (DMT)-like permease